MWPRSQSGPDQAVTACWLLASMLILGDIGVKENGQGSCGRPPGPWRWARRGRRVLMAPVSPWPGPPSGSRGTGPGVQVLAACLSLLPLVCPAGIER